MSVDLASLDGLAARSPLVARAMARASDAHAGQVRNGSGGMPYVEHPRRVARKLAAAGYDDEVIAAGLLHDVVEDSESTVGDLRSEFGERIAALVAALSDDQGIADYRARKDEHRARVLAAGGDALAIYAADKLTNTSTLATALEHEGANVAGEFDVPLALKLSVWREDVRMLHREAPQLSFLGELDEAVSRLGEDLAVAGLLPRS